MINSQIFQILQPTKQLPQIIFDVLKTESMKESLNKILLFTMNGLNLKYSITIWVISSCTNKLTNFGKLDFPFTNYK